MFAKKGGAPVAALEIKVDTYVLETDVHFPTDLNLLWDAGRKCVDLIEWLARALRLRAARLAQVQGLAAATQEPANAPPARSSIAAGRTRKPASKPPCASIWPWAASSPPKCGRACWACAIKRWTPPAGNALAYFHAHARQASGPGRAPACCSEETIPAHEKVFSLFEPHTEWIQKGKQRPNVELGHRLLIATDQHQLIQDYDVPVGGADVDQSVPVADRLLGRYGPGSLASLSFDKGFTRAEDRELLSLYVPTVVMPKRGKKNAAETRTREREEVCGPAQATQRGGERDQQPGTSRTEPLPGRGDGGLPALCGLRGDELQPARHRPGVAGAGTGARRDTLRAGGLKPPTAKPQAKSDRGGVASAGES